jgi:uracil-DNA glycosylase family 4
MFTRMGGMLTKPRGCDSCPLRDKGQGFVPDTISLNPEYIFIGESPGKQELEAGVPFIGKAGFVLRQWMVKNAPSVQISLEKNRVTIANTLRCLSPEIQGSAYPRGEEKLQAEECCSQYNQFGDAKTIVLFGEKAQRRWFKSELEAEDAVDRQLNHDTKGVLGRNGREYLKDERRYVFCVHPAAILRQPSLVEAGQNALRIAAQTEQVLEINYIGWNDAIKEVFALQNRTTV